MGPIPATWIYVTGAPRSGTTFVGKILATPLSVDYIHEPFNPECGIPGLERRYLYVRAGSAEEASLRPLIEDLMRYRTRLKTAMYARDGRAKRAIKSIVGSRGPFYLRLARANPFTRAAVVKDPVGCLLTSWLVSEFGFRAVALVRHPVAFVASTRRLRWDLEAHLAALAEQPSLIEDHFSTEPAFLRRRWGSQAERGAALWRALNAALLQQAADHPDRIRLITHEELSRGPEEVFGRLFRWLDLPWSDRVRRRIRRLTAAGNRAEAQRGRVQEFARDSAALLELRLRQIDPEERRRIWEIAGDVAGRFYTEEGLRPGCPAVG